MVLNPRIDFQIGKHILTLRDYYYNSTQTGAGVGALSLAEQAMSVKAIENTFQFGDTFVVGPRACSTSCISSGGMSVPSKPRSPLRRRLSYQARLSRR